MAGDQYSIAEMEDMEVKLLVALKWKLKIVTPYDFTSLLMKKLFPNLNLDCQKNIEEIVDYCLMGNSFSDINFTLKIISEFTYCVLLPEKKIALWQNFGEE